MAAAGFDEVEVTDLGRFDASSVSDADVRSVLVTARRAVPSPVTLRPAVPGDLDAIGRLLAAEGLPLEGFDVDSAVVLIGAGVTVEGVVMLEQFSGGSSFLRSLAVSPSSRQQGLGKRLTRAAVEMSGARLDRHLPRHRGRRRVLRQAGLRRRGDGGGAEGLPVDRVRRGLLRGASAMRLRHEQDSEASSCCAPG